ncbi:MAG TPA: hypothetical protein VH280_14820 [Verrucomicrobiae bacterium]|jgi:hypothetical protein|nr:hypothetical protein [Verrucomicrobiae bacterium]
MNLIESIWDRIWDAVLCRALLLVLIVLGLVILAIDFFFESFFPGVYDRLFSSPAGEAIEFYRTFRRDHPAVCWFLQWPLLSVGM